MAFAEIGRPQGFAPAYRATKYELTIFNPWGQVEYFEAKQAPCPGFANWSITWDGRSSLRPSGWVEGYTVYTWMLKIWNCDGGDPKVYAENITVF